MDVVSSIPTGGNFIFADFETSGCQFCTKMTEMLDLCYLGKTRLSYLSAKKTHEFELFGSLNYLRTFLLCACFCLYF